METEKEIEEFLLQYNYKVYNDTMKLRKVLFANLPGIIEQIDIPAKMIAFCYGQKYIDLICTIIPSKNGVKLGFNRGIDLADPENQLKGTGKISRYVEIKSTEQIASSALKKLIVSALEKYKQRIGLGN